MCKWDMLVGTHIWVAKYEINMGLCAHAQAMSIQLVHADVHTHIGSERANGMGPHIYRHGQPCKWSWHVYKCAQTASVQRRQFQVHRCMGCTCANGSNVYTEGVK